MFDMYQKGEFVKRISAEEIEKHFFDLTEKDKYVYMVLNKNNTITEEQIDDILIAEKIKNLRGSLASLHFHVCKKDAVVQEYDWIFQNNLVFYKETQLH